MIFELTTPQEIIVGVDSRITLALNAELSSSDDVVVRINNCIVIGNNTILIIVAGLVWISLTVAAVHRIVVKVSG